MNVTPLFVDRRSPSGLTIRQVGNEAQGAGLIYPDQPSFLADGEHFVYHGEGSLPTVCNLTTLATRPLLEEPASLLHLGPGGRFAVWQVLEDDRLTLRRLDVASGRIEEVFAADGNLPGTSLPAKRFRLSAVSGDGKRVATSFWMGDGSQADAPFGVISIDLEAGTACVAAEATDFNNTHLQYSRCQDEEAARDLLVQHNHGAHTDAAGKVTCSLGAPSEGGCDVHVVRDDGANWRDLPWGRDGRESCIGHQVWRGTTRQATTVTLQNIDTSYGWASGTRQEVVAGTPVPADQHRPHRGRRGRAAHRVELSKGCRGARFCHLCCDDSGLRFVLDTFPIFDGKRTGMHVFLASTPDYTSPLKFQYVLNTGIVFNPNNGYHAHPILSPDGRAMLFNSNVSGTRRPYVVTGFEFPV